MSKCPYCDFYSVPVGSSGAPHDEYLRAVRAQLERDAPLFAGREITTVYFGGGTPSLMPPAFFAGLLDDLFERFAISADAEISCEVNPSTAGAPWFEDAREAGITRISIGVQSFQDGLLRELGRAHRAEDAMRAVACAQEAGFPSVGCDLIFGIPNETILEVEEDVRIAMTFQPQHVSAYQLTLEEGTPLYERLKGRDSLLVTRDSDDEILEQMRTVARMLGGMGRERYEISNFAKPGFACRHNVNYWRYGEYLGLGAAATSFAYDSTTVRQYDGTAFGNRWTQVRDVSAYIDGPAAAVEVDEIDQRTAMAEYCFMGLRMTEGISTREFERLFGVSFDGIFGAEVAGLEREGLVEGAGERLALTGRGIELSNQVFERFLP